MSEQDIEALVDHLSENPDAGDEMEGTVGVESYAGPLEEITKVRAAVFEPSRCFPGRIFLCS